MTMKALFFLTLLVAIILPVQARAQRRADESHVFDEMRQGHILPLRDIERRVLPGMAGAQYIGFDFDSQSGVYTLKFLRNGSVIWVDVDGRSGQIIGRSGR
jgi:hypothetical protein